MRRAGIASLVLTAALLLLGCSATPSSTPGTSAEAAKAKRDEYAREMSKRLTEFDQKCQQLADQITKAEGQAKKDLEKKLDDAKGLRDAAAKRLDELKEAGADRWEKIKEGVGNALDDLKKVFD